MADEKPKNEQLSFSGDWHKDVGTWKNEKQKERTYFYTQTALLSLRVDNENEIQQALKNPAKYNISTSEKITSAAKFEHKIVKGDTLGELLLDFFSTLNDATDVQKNMKVSLYELTQQKMNVDLVRADNSLAIEGGTLIIFDSSKNEVARYVLRRSHIEDSGGETEHTAPQTASKETEKTIATAEKPKEPVAAKEKTTPAKTEPTHELSEEEDSAPKKAPKPTPKPKSKDDPKPVARPKPGSTPPPKPQAPKKPTVPEAPVVVQAPVAPEEPTVPQPPIKAAAEAPIAADDGTYTISFAPDEEQPSAIEATTPVEKTAPAPTPALPVEVPAAAPAVAAIASTPPPSSPAPGAAPAPAPVTAAPTAGPSAGPMGLSDRMSLINKIASVDDNEIDLSYLTTLDKEGAEIIAKVPQLKSLWLNGLTTLDTEVAEVLAKAPQLKYLALNGLTTLDKGVAEALAKAPQLRMVFLKDTDLTKSDLESLAGAAPSAEAPSVSSQAPSAAPALSSEAPAHVEPVTAAPAAIASAPVEPAPAVEVAPAPAPATDTPIQNAEAIPFDIKDELKKLNGVLPDEDIAETRKRALARYEVIMAEHLNNEDAEPSIKENIVSEKNGILSADKRSLLRFNLLESKADEKSGKQGDNDLREQDRQAMYLELLEGAPSDRTKARMLIYLTNSYLAEYWNGKAWGRDYSPENAIAFANIAIQHIEAVKKNEDSETHDPESYGYSYEAMLEYAHQLRLHALVKLGRNDAAIGLAKKSPQYKHILDSFNEGETYSFKYDGSLEFIELYLKALKDPINDKLRDEEIDFVINAYKAGSLMAPDILDKWWRSAKDADELDARLAKVLDVPVQDIAQYSKRHFHEYERYAITEIDNKNSGLNPFMRAPSNYKENRYLWLVELGDSYGSSIKHNADKKRLYNAAFDMCEHGWSAVGNSDEKIIGQRKEAVLKRISETINQDFYHDTRYSGWIRGSERGVNIVPGNKRYIVDRDYLYFDLERKILVAKYVNADTHKYGDAYVFEIRGDGSIYNTHLEGTTKSDYDFYDTDGNQLFFDSISKKLVSLKEGAMSPTESHAHELAQMLEKHYNQKITVSREEEDGKLTYFLNFEKTILMKDPIDIISFTSTSWRDGYVINVLRKASGGGFADHGALFVGDSETPTLEDVMSKITGEKVKPATKAYGERPLDPSLE